MEIYHYMPLEALHSMLNTYIKEQKSDNSLTFWASSALHMNDKNEIIESFNVIKDYVRIIEKQFIDKIEDVLFKKKQYESHDIKIDECNYFDLSDYVDNADFKVEKETLHNMSLLQYFVVSFSNARDFLPMWNTYGDGGVGVCLKFEADDLYGNINGFENVNINYHSDVLYKPEDILLDKYEPQLNALIDIYGRYVLKSLEINKQDSPDLLLNEIINRICIPIMELYDFPNHDKLSNMKLDNLPDDSIPEKSSLKKFVLDSLRRRTINEMILNLSPIVKHPCFTYEGEHRFVILLAKKRDMEGKVIIPQFVKYRINKNGNIIPYIEMKIPVESIKEIIIGPCADSERIQDCLNLEMDSCRFHRIPITPSTIPFRHY